MVVFTVWVLAWRPRRRVIRVGFVVRVWTTRCLLRNGILAVDASCFGFCVGMELVLGSGGDTLVAFVLIDVAGVVVRDDESVAELDVDGVDEVDKSDSSL